MTESLVQSEAVLEVISPDGARKYVRVQQTPFLIGRGAETGNHLQLTDRRISRNCAAIVIEANRAVDMTQETTSAGRLARQERDRLTQLAGAPGQPK